MCKHPRQGTLESLERENYGMKPKGETKSQTGGHQLDPAVVRAR